MTKVCCAMLISVLSFISLQYLAPSGSPLFLFGSCHWSKISMTRLHVCLFNNRHIEAGDHWVIWATTWQNQQNGCAPSEDWDQPGHLPSLTRVFAVRMKKVWCQQEHLVISLICCKFQKKSLWCLILYNFFFMILYMYIAPGQGQTAPSGHSFDVNRNVLSLHSFVANLKQVWFYTVFTWFYTCI